MPPNTPKTPKTQSGSGAAISSSYGNFIHDDNELVNTSDLQELRTHVMQLSQLSDAEKMAWQEAIVDFVADRFLDANEMCAQYQSSSGVDPDRLSKSRSAYNQIAKQQDLAFFPVSEPAFAGLPARLKHWRANLEWLEQKEGVVRTSGEQPSIERGGLRDEDDEDDEDEDEDEELARFESAQEPIDKHVHFVGEDDLEVFPVPNNSMRRHVESMTPEEHREYRAGIEQARADARREWQLEKLEARREAANQMRSNALYGRRPDAPKPAGAWVRGSWVPDTKGGGAMSSRSVIAACSCITALVAMIAK